MNSSLVYIGDVKITVSRKSYKYKNSGTPLLFEYFARWLAGQTLGSDILPDHLVVMEGDTVVSRNNIPITINYKTTSNGPSAIVSGVILDSNLSNLSESQNHILELRNSVDDPIAQIKIDYEILAQIKTGRQALIEWSMRITNKEIK